MNFILGPEAVDQGLGGVVGWDHAKAAGVRNQKAQIGPEALKQDQCSWV